MKLHRAWQLGFVLPMIIAIAFLADVAMRFTPIDPYTFRAWEAMTRFPAPNALFEANKRYYNARTYGNLAGLGNLPALRQYRSETFSTDAYGFRNPPEASDGRPVSAIIFGDSFVVGNGVNDDQTLSVQLSAATGKTVYNAGGTGASLENIRALARRLKMSQGTIIYAHTGLHQLWAGASGWIWLNGLTTVSPLKVASQQAYRTLQNDLLLPNTYTSNVVQARLLNNDVTLFRPQDIRRYYQQQPDDHLINQWATLAAELRKDNLDLLILLVPTKYAVYRPLLKEGQGPEPADGILYLDKIERRVRESGITVVNLTPTFRAAAAAGLDRKEYIYWLDDTHWNADGIALAVVEIKKVLKQ